MRIVKIVVMIVIILLVFVLVLSGVFDGTVDRLGATMTAGVTGNACETKDGNFLVANKHREKFVDQMLGDGWAFVGSTGDLYTFERSGQIVEYQGKHFLIGFTIYELTE